MTDGKKDYCCLCPKKWNWSFIFSIIAFGLSVFAAFQCDKRIEADWMGVLVGILSLLVAILLGWQIYKTIDIDKKIDAKINEKIKISRDLMEKRINDIQGEVEDNEKNLIRNLRDVSTLLLDFNDDGEYSFINDAFSFYYYYSKSDVDGIAKRMSFNLIVATLDKESIDDNKEITRLNRVQVRFFLDEYEKTENPKPYVIGNLRKIINQ